MNFKKAYETDDKNTNTDEKIPITIIEIKKREVSIRAKAQ